MPVYVRWRCSLLGIFSGPEPWIPAGLWRVRIILWRECWCFKHRVWLSYDYFYLDNNSEASGCCTCWPSFSQTNPLSITVSFLRRQSLSLSSLTTPCKPSYPLFQTKEIWMLKSQSFLKPNPNFLLTLSVLTSLPPTFPWQHNVVGYLCISLGGGKSQAHITGLEVTVHGQWASQESYSEVQCF